MPDDFGTEMITHTAWTTGAYLAGHATEIGAVILMSLQGYVLFLKIKKYRKENDDTKSGS